MAGGQVELLVELDDDELAYVHGTWDVAW
jgi:hypothetical protein